MVRRCAPASGLPPRRRDPDGRIADDRLTLVRRLDAMARHLADELADGLAERCVALLGRGNAPGFNGLGPGCRREMLQGAGKALAPGMIALLENQQPIDAAIEAAVLIEQAR